MDNWLEQNNYMATLDEIDKEELKEIEKEHEYNWIKAY